jgi:hypothetical protein
MRMDRRKLLYFEWVIIDKCDMGCSYCIDKAVHSQKPDADILYVPGYEIETAEKILELCDHAETVLVSICAAEPLLAVHIKDVFSILEKGNNINIRLFTNLNRLADVCEDIVHLGPRVEVVGSLHISYHGDEWVDRLLRLVNQYKEKVRFRLSQVDHELNGDDRRRLFRIERDSGMPVCYVTYVQPAPPASGLDLGTDGKKNANESKFQASLGKRCCLGYSHFFLNPDGTFKYGLWCMENKIGPFHSIHTSSFDQYILDGMLKCPRPYCVCNYNVHDYDAYLAACESLGYPKREIMQPAVERPYQRFKRKISGLITKSMYFK